MFDPLMIATVCQVIADAEDPDVVEAVLMLLDDVCGVLEHGPRYKHDARVLAQTLLGPYASDSAAQRLYDRYESIR